jgi:cytochrome c oxidase subunit II
MASKPFLFVLSVAMSAAFALPAAAQAQTTPREIEITAKRFSYEPPEITLKKGEAVILVLKSADVAHGLRFRELNVDVKASKGGTGQVKFTPERTGTFVGRCSVFCGAGHSSMTLKLHVVN